MIRPSEMPRRRERTRPESVTIPATLGGDPYVVRITPRGYVRLSRAAAGHDHYLIFDPRDAFEIADALVDAAEQAQAATDMGQKPRGIEDTREA